MSKPQINVTPLIDVLLVLLIIFMVITPLKPSSFKTRVPAEPREFLANVTPHPDTLVVAVGADSSLALNRETGLGTTQKTGEIVERLRSIFDQRISNGQVSQSFADEPGRPYTDRIERTVFIKAPRSAAYGEIARVVDAVKLAGAHPISLQIDRLD